MSSASQPVSTPAPENPTPSPAPPSRRRFYLPLVVLVGAPLIYFSSERIVETLDAQRMVTAGIRWLVLLLSPLLLALWLVFFSGLGRLRGLVVVLACVALFFALVREFHISGDVEILSVEFRWQPTRDQILAAHRQKQQTISAAAVNLMDVSDDDMPTYRGRQAQGVVEVKGLLTDWTKSKPKLLWKQPVGEGWSAFSAVNNFAVTHEQRGPNEVIACYEVATGKEVWSYGYPTRFSDVMGGPGPRSTPTIYAGDVFTYGANGKLVCLDGSNGQLRWQVDTLSPQNANKQWAMSGSPLVFEDKVIVHPGAQKPEAAGQAIQAYNVKDGKLLWQVGSRMTGYCSPMLVTLCGVQILVLFDGEGIGGYSPADGKELWFFEWKTNGVMGINVAQPLLLPDDRLFICSGYDKHGATLQVRLTGSEWKCELVAETKPNVMRCKFGNPVVSGDYIYGLDDGRLDCVRWADGQRMWTDRRRPRKGEAYGHGQMLLVRDPQAKTEVILVMTESNELVLVEPSSEGLREKGRFIALLGEKTWNNPAIARGKLLVRNASEMACFDLTQGE